MLDPIGGAASAVTIVDRTLAAATWVLRKVPFGRIGARPVGSLRPPHKGFGLFPLSLPISCSTHLLSHR